MNLIAGQGNVTVQGSNVVGENGLTVQAKNIDIKEAENKVYSEDFHSKKKSGVLGGGGLGVTFGAQKQTLESDKRSLCTGQPSGELKWQHHPPSQRIITPKRQVR